MSDLSRLLDDVYGDRTTDAPAAAPEVPEEPREQQDWSADAVLDEAFADWVTDPTPPVPGEHHVPAGPVPGERVAGETEGAAAVTSPRGVPRSSFTDFADEPVATAPVLPAPAPQATSGWHRDDDDILPTRRARRSMGGRSTGPAAAASTASPHTATADERTVDAAAGAELLPRPAPRRFRLRRG